MSQTTQAIEHSHSDALDLENGPACLEKNALMGGEYCHLSSLAFITNAIHSYFCHYYLYSALFCALTVTSVIYHSHLWDCSAVYIIDKMAVYCVVAYGGYIFYNTLMELYEEDTLSLSTCDAYLCICVASTFGAVLYLYYYGYTNCDYCFHQNINVSSYYHSILHLISSVGHHLILMLRFSPNIMSI